MAGAMNRTKHVPAATPRAPRKTFRRPTSYTSRHVGTPKRMMRDRPSNRWSILLRMAGKAEEADRRLRMNGPPIPFAPEEAPRHAYRGQRGPGCIHLGSPVKLRASKLRLGNLGGRIGIPVRSDSLRLGTFDYNIYDSPPGHSYRRGARISWFRSFWFSPRDHSNL